MDFIFMLTRADRTVPDCAAALETAIAAGVRHIGFKDVGVPQATLAALVRRMREAGVTSYLEVVSESPAAGLRSARMAVEMGVDRLLGGTEVDATLALLAGSCIGYYPFPGRPEGHPTRLGGSPADVEADCRRFVAAGCAGADLLAFRATESEPPALVRAAREVLPPGGLVVAGSIASAERIAELAAAGVDAFTIGSALFDGSYRPTARDLGDGLARVMAASAAAGAVTP